MDKYEYKVRADEIKELIAQGEYAQAAEIADTIDWRRVKSVMMLCTISDLYKINRRYEDARDMLLLAYERRPGGRTICYSLCELSIKMEEYVQAVEYYKEFVQVAPKDPGRYILQYKLYEAQDVSLEERIEVLEELKKHDYREKWAYELAYLYHRVGLATRCVEECDEMILWFGDGKYVIKAMELKMLHEPLTPEQQAKYDNRFGTQAEESLPAANENPDENVQYAAYEGDGAQGYPEEGSVSGDTQIYQPVAGGTSAEDNGAGDEMDIHVKTMDVGQYNTINLQAELAAGLKEVLGEDNRESIQNPVTRSIVAPMLESDTESLDYPQIEEVNEDDLEPEQEQMEGTEVFFGATGEIGDVAETVEEPEKIRSESPVVADSQNIVEIQPQEESAGEEAASETEPEKTNVSKTDETAETVMEQMRLEELGKEQQTMLRTEPPKELAGVLSQESDGQISLVVPEKESIEKQITGQMSIEDILTEWERMKKENEEKRKEEVRQHVLQQTGTMFTEFEASVRDGLLEQLENGEIDSVDDAAATEEFSEGELPEETAAEETAGEELVEESTGEEAAGEELAEESAEEAYAEESAEGEFTEEELTEETAGEEAVMDESAEEFTGEEYAEEAAEGEYVEGELTEGEAAGEELAEEFTGEEYAGETVAGEYAEGELTEGEAVGEELAEEFNGEEPAEESAVEEAVMDESAEELTEEAYAVESAEGEYAEDELREAEAVGEESTEEFSGEEPAEEPVKNESVGEESAEKPAGKNATDKTPAENKSQRPAVERDKAKIRALTREEKELYAPYIQSRKAREQLVQAVDSISLAAYTGNVIITGEEGMDTLTLAKNMIREIQMEDSNFSGKVAKISGNALNNKNVSTIVNDLKNGALIIQKASGMNPKTVQDLNKSLQQETTGIVVVLEDTKRSMNHFLDENEELHGCFTARMDVEALSNDTLVAFGRQYAREMEYSINEMGVLALHTRIEDMQTSDHVVTVMEVKEIVDEAIRHANKKTLGHFFDVLFAKRYDDEDMIVLGEKDFA